MSQKIVQFLKLRKDDMCRARAQSMLQCEECTNCFCFSRKISHDQTK